MVRCCSMFGAARTPSSTASAKDRGLEACQEIQSAYRKLAEIALAPNAAVVLADLWRDMTRLEGLISNSPVPEPSSWKLPQPQEQADWERAYPKGGVLLRRQLCTAASGPGDAEFFMGGVFVADAGMAFDTGSVEADERLQTGLVPWGSVAAMERSAQELTVRLVEGAVGGLAELRLQLAPADAAWIEELWRLQTAPPADASAAAPAAAAASSLIAAGAAAPIAGGTLLEQETPVLLKQLSSPEPTKALHQMLTLDARLSQEYNEAPEGRKPFQAPEKEAPVGTEAVAGLEASRIAEVVRSDNYLSRFLRDAKQATDVSMTPWSESRSAPGVLVRKVTFTLPVPQDFPKAVTRLVNLPTQTRVTAIFRMHEQADGALAITVQFCSHDIPFGENFRVHETVVFRSDGNGGVQATKWVEVMWIATLPWAYGILKAIIEQKCKADGLGSRLVKDLRNSAASVDAKP